MVAPPITEDYYLILEVEQNATTQLIVSSYRRLALKLHPDRNAKHDATEAFQRLGRAYETLNDETKRRAYDLIYPRIRQNRQTPRPTSTSSSSTPKTDTPSEAAQIAAIQKSKQERAARWQTKKSTFDSSIFDLQRRIRQLQQQIKTLDTISAAEAAEEARKNSWGAWLLSPIYKKVEESEEDKERRSRERQERRIEKDLKERRMEAWNAQLKAQERSLEEARELVEAADRCDDDKIRVIKARVAAREAQERREREWERLEKERQEREKLRQQREREAREEQEKLEEYFRMLAEQAEKRRQEAAETARKLYEENLAARQQRARQTQNHHYYNTTYSSYAFARDDSPPPGISTCEHHGWWPKVQGRTNCPSCDESWTYLLRCPGCDIKRCPRCQAAIRPARQRWRPRERSPSPVAFYDWYD